MTHEKEYDQESYQVAYRSNGASSAKPRSERPTFGRKGKTPQQFNGIHRRRRKKIRW